MAELIKMPRLSDTMEEGTVASWLKKVGDKVEEGDILAEIETDKATMEFESFYEGTLLYIGVKEGETTNVDEPLAIIGEPNEDFKSLLNPGISVENKKTNKIEEKQSVDEKDEVISMDSNSLEIPKDVTVVTMPRLSDTMEEGTVASWLKKIGEKVEEGDILAEIETDKATMEFESFQSGYLLYKGLEEGDSAKVDDLLAIIGPKELDVTAIVNNFKRKVSDSIEEPKAIKKEKEEILENVEKIIKVSKPEHSNNKRIFASPLAKKLAADKNIDLSLLRGSGENGRIIKIDIQNYSPGSGSVKTINFSESFEEIKHSQMRKQLRKD